MRTEQEMYDLILGVARDDERIRAVYVNGSRSNPGAKKDCFQDFDIVYLVTETASFLADPHWIDVFGERLILQLPDEMDKIVGKSNDFSRCYGYLMQFRDGNRIDLSIQTLDLALEEITQDSLTVVLLDKDRILPNLPEPSDRSYWVKKPAEPLYLRCCNEFRWIVLYIAKGLWRGQIPYAMDCLNLYVRPQLTEMLCWYAGIRTDFSCGMGKSGNHLVRYLPNAMWKRYLLTYPSADIEAMWAAVLLMAELFEETARAVGKALGFTYNTEEARNVLSYLKHIYALPKDAKEIF